MIQTLVKLRQKDCHEFVSSLGYLARSSLKNKQEEQRVWLNGRLLAWLTQSPGFNLNCHKKKIFKNEFNGTEAMAQLVKSLLY